MVRRRRVQVGPVVVWPAQRVAVSWCESSPATVWMVSHVPVSAQVPRECPPVSEVCGAVLDADTASGVLALALVDFLVTRPAGSSRTCGAVASRRGRRSERPGADSRRQ